MDFSFGIITGASNNEKNLAWRDNMLCIFDSIRRLKILNYEIVVVGGPNPADGRNWHKLHSCPDVVHVPFDDEVVLEILKSEDNDFRKPYPLTDKSGTVHKKNINFDEKAVNQHDIAAGWITKKKNLITQNAKYENIVYMHDYHIPRSDWYEGFLKFGGDWDVCMTKIEDFWGHRFRDWVSWDSPKHGKRKLVDYDDTSQDFIKHCYISGSYWVAKKKFMEENPLDEQYLWGQGEDLEWSFRIRDTFNYKMNKFSTVKHIRPKLTGDEKWHIGPFAARGHPPTRHFLGGPGINLERPEDLKGGPGFDW